MKLQKKLLSGSIAIVFFMIAIACKNSYKSKDSEMTNMTLPVQDLFEKTKTVCFGRFMVDVPVSAKIVWGNISVPYSLEIYRDGVGKVKKEAQKFIDELKSDKAINHDNVPLLLAVQEIKQPEGEIVVGYESFEAISQLKIRAYFNIDQNGVILSSRPLLEERKETIDDLISTAQRLRRRSDDEIPNESGNCIEYAFVADKKNPSGEDLYEHIRLGFRLNEIPDAHFSIYVAPAGDEPEDDSLESQMKETKNDMTSISERLVLAKTKFFRERKRQIGDWHTGYEVLMRSPDEEGSLSHHDFHLRFNGVSRDPYKPYADIKFQTGVTNNAAGATKASLTDEEAIAIWDKITSSIRVRPTTNNSIKSSDAGHTQHKPLGELAATGRTCPQTGWWEVSEEDEIAGERRRYLQAGELMPHVMSQGKPSMWQKLKGEQPTYRAATVWKLVSYEAGPSQEKAATPIIAQTHTDGAKLEKSEYKGRDLEGGNSVGPQQNG
jgi:hypothetical protein